jgi:hypothetical protein
MKYIVDNELEGMGRLKKPPKHSRIRYIEG